MNTHPNLSQQYLDRHDTFIQNASEAARKYRQFSWVRLLLFLISIGGTVLCFDFHWSLGLGGGLAFVILFIRFVKWHQAFKKQESHNLYLAQINKQENGVLQHSYSSFNDGQAFLDTNHPNALDLDLFGPYSFFQFTNRASTYLGQKRLANWLLVPADVSTILLRQNAIATLATQLDWRQKWQALGMGTEDKQEHLSLLQQWLQRPYYLLPLRWLPPALLILPLLTIAAVFYYFPILPWYIIILFLIPNAMLLRRFLDRINQTHQKTSHAEAVLSRYAFLVSHLRNMHPKDAQILITAQQNLNQDAGKAIRRLSYLISQLNVRYNAFAIIFNLFGLWDLHWVYRLEKWKKTNKEKLPVWFDQLAEIEALISLATTAYNNPSWVFPTFHQEAHLHGKNIGHPLLANDKRITNDLNMPTTGHIKLITGSNMAGKSTYLRTVGLNIVLARSGSVVCASAFRLPPLQVYTSMRTQDALHESTSSFYAELKRLKFIIEAVEHQDHIFFLLDEILKGTNSNDRHTGSKALIRQLIKQGGGGLIATHDLELGSLESQYNGAIENLCMEVRIENDQLFFDYKIHPGVSQSFNATLLMKNMGIKITDSDKV